MVGQSWGCRWRLTVDGAPAGLQYASHTSTASGWRIDPHLLEWVVSGVSAGVHTYRIEVDRPSAGSASECLAGWPNNDTENLLLVEEID